MEFLVFGHGPNSGHIFSVQNPGVIDDRSIVGFSAIGSGSFLALASLVGSNLPGTLDETIYSVCDAKFRAESASGVGRDTVLAILHPDGIERFIVTRLPDIKTQWRSLQPKPSIEMLQIIALARTESKTTAHMTAALAELKKPVED